MLHVCFFFKDTAFTEDEMKMSLGLLKNGMPDGGVHWDEGLEALRARILIHDCIVVDEKSCANAYT
jgi:hypothetical protein